MIMSVWKSGPRTVTIYTENGGKSYELHLQDDYYNYTGVHYSSTLELAEDFASSWVELQ